MMNRFDEQLEQSEHERYWAERLDQLGADIHFETRPNGVRIVKIVNRNKLSAEAETTHTAAVPRKREEQCNGLTDALKAKDRSAIRECVSRMCEKMKIDLRGISFGEAPDGGNDSILYIDIDREELDFNAVAALITRFKKETQ